MPKKVVIWSEAARLQLRAVDREMAKRILAAIDQYLTTGSGDVIKLQPPRHEFRLRIGDYRVAFLQCGPFAIEVVSVSHRSKAYR